MGNPGEKSDYTYDDILQEIREGTPFGKQQYRVVERLYDDSLKDTPRLFTIAGKFGEVAREVKEEKKVKTGYEPINQTLPRFNGSMLTFQNGVKFSLTGNYQDGKAKEMSLSLLTKKTSISRWEGKNPVYRDLQNLIEEANRMGANVVASDEGKNNSILYYFFRISDDKVVALVRDYTVDALKTKAETLPLEGKQ